MLIKNVKILGHDFNITEGSIRIVDSIIDDISSDLVPLEDEFVIDGSGNLIMPGFYNCHAHSPMSIMRGYGENLSLQDWLTKKIFPFEAKLKGEDVYWSTLLSLSESLMSGIVSTTDMYYFTEYMVEAIGDAKVKNNISRSIVADGDKAYSELKSVSEMKDYYGKFNNKFDGKIKVDMSIHAEYTSNREIVTELSKYAKSIGANMHVHISETKKEVESCLSRNSMTPVEYFESCGALDLNTTAAHCVWVDSNDISILKKNRVNVATNPTSNLKLASGIAPINQLLDSGINIVLGTDGVASNNSIDMFNEMKLVALLSKYKSESPVGIDALDVLKMATVNGARSQGRTDCGLIKKGNRADLVLLDIDAVNIQPIYDVVSNIIYSGNISNVKMTMVDGEILYRDGEFTSIDIEKVKYEVNSRKDRICQNIHC